MNMFKKIALYFFATTLIFVGGISFAHASASDNVSGWAWSDTIGWVSFNCTDGGPTVSNTSTNICATGNGSYGVNVDGSGNLSGYAWSDNVGWISFNVGDVGTCPSGSQAKLTGTVFSGWARALAGNTTSGWDGCISLSGLATVSPFSPYSVTYSGVATGVNVQNYAWGSDVVGWLQFNPTSFGGVKYVPPSNTTFDYGLTNNKSATGVQIQKPIAGANANTASATVTISKTAGTAEEVTLTASSVPTLPGTNITVSLSNSGKCTPNNSCTVDVTVSVPNNATVNKYTITLTGAPLSKTTSFDVFVVPPQTTLRGATSNSCGGSINLDWDRVTGADGYDIFNASDVNVGTAVGEASISAVVTTANPNTSATYKIKTYKTYNNTKYTSPYSNTVTVTSSAACAQNGSVRIQRVSGDANLTDISTPATVSKVDSGGTTNSNNPSDFISVSVGDHTLYSTEILGHDVRARFCKFNGTPATGVAGCFTGNEPDSNVLPCTGGFCTYSASQANGSGIELNKTTKAVYIYTPKTPTNFVVATISNTCDALDLEWDKIDGITSFKIYKDNGTNLFKTITSSDYTVVGTKAKYRLTGLTAGTQYPLYIRSVGVNSAISAPSDQGFQTTPTGCGQAQTGTLEVYRLKDNNVGSSPSKIVFDNIANSGGYTKANNTEASSNNSPASFTDVSPGTYPVFATVSGTTNFPAKVATCSGANCDILGASYNDASCQVVSNTYLKCTTTNNVSVTAGAVTKVGFLISPVVPTNVSAGANSCGSTYVAWDPIPGQFVNIYKSTSSGGTYTLLAGNQSGFNFSDSAVTPGTTYYYKIAGVFQSGGPETAFVGPKSATAPIACSSSKGALNITRSGNNFLTTSAPNTKAKAVLFDNGGGKVGALQVPGSSDGVSNNNPLKFSNVIPDSDTGNGYAYYAYSENLAGYTITAGTCTSSSDITSDYLCGTLNTAQTDFQNPVTLDCTTEVGWCRAKVPITANVGTKIAFRYDNGVRNSGVKIMRVDSNFATADVPSGRIDILKTDNTVARAGLTGEELVLSDNTLPVASYKARVTNVAGYTVTARTCTPYTIGSQECHTSTTFTEVPVVCDAQNCLADMTTLADKVTKIVFIYTPIPAQVGGIQIKRVGSTGGVPSFVLNSRIVSNSSVVAEEFSNDSVFNNKPLGSYTAESQEKSGYSVTAAKCTYTGTNECFIANFDKAESYDITPSFDGGYYKVPVDITAGVITKIVFRYEIIPEPERLSVACSGAPATVDIGQNVTWTADPRGGSGNYAYTWGGSASGTGRNSTVSYTTAGTKTATIVLTDTTRQVSTEVASCSIVVNEDGGGDPIDPTTPSMSVEVALTSSSQKYSCDATTGVCDDLIIENNTQSPSSAYLKLSFENMARCDGIPNSETGSETNLTSSPREYNLTLPRRSNPYVYTFECTDTGGNKYRDTARIFVVTSRINCNPYEGGSPVNDGVSKYYYNSRTAPAGASCSRRLLLCDDGVWRNQLYTPSPGNAPIYIYPSCSSITEI